MSTSKTYSVTIQLRGADGRKYWITNIRRYSSPEEIDWGKVADYCQTGGALAYGYQSGRDSRNQTSARTRTVIAVLPKQVGGDKQ